MLIEIVDIYESEHQAESLLSDLHLNSRKKKKLKENSSTFDTLSLEINKKLTKLNLGNYDGLGKQKKIVLLCGLMDPFINELGIRNITDQYKKIPIKRDMQRNFDEIWLMWESPYNNRYEIFRLE